MLNLTSLLLNLMKPLSADFAKFLPKIEFEYLANDFRIEFSKAPKLAEGGDLSVCSEGTVNGDDHEADSEDEDADMLAAAIALSMKPYANPG